MQRSRPANGAIFWPLVLVVVVVDIVTKAIAVETLQPRGIPHPVFGEWFRWTLVYNPGAAFGLHLGDYSRWIFMVLTLGALVIGDEVGPSHDAMQEFDLDGSSLRIALTREA